MKRRGASKVAILGYTEHKRQAPFLNTAWEIWGLNDLYLDLPDIPNPSQRIRWFQLHQWPENGIVPDAEHNPFNFSEGPVNPRDPNHVNWMRRNAEHIPIYLMQPHESVPKAQVLPIKELIEFFGVPYFTNSITWMIGLAIMEITEDVQVNGRTYRLAKKGAELGVFGVDMMTAGGQGSEYGWQRPSCEWLLGDAMARGVKVTIPAESDLLKTAFQYGELPMTPFRKKLKQLRSMIEQRRVGFANQKMQMMLAESEAQGARNAYDHILFGWMPGDEGDMHSRAPEPNAHKAGALRLQGQPLTAQERLTFAQPVDPQQLVKQEKP